MKFYHVAVGQEDGWFIGRVLDREGITTQGRSLDELLFMVRDAIELMWNERGVQIELIIPNQALTAIERRKKPGRTQRPKTRTPTANARRKLAKA